MGQYLLGIDVGTTGSKAIVFDLAGKALASGYREYSCIYPNPNWVEQDVDLLCRSAMEACKEAIAKAGIDPADVLSASISAQRCCLVLVDKDGNALKMISWMDNRAIAEVEEINKIMGAEAFYKVSGMPLGTTWLLPKILWVRNNEPQIWDKTVRMVQLHDYALKAFGSDDYYSDEPDCAFWGFWNTDKIDWDEAMLEQFNLDKKMLPAVYPTGTKIGAVSRQAAAASGLLEGTPLSIGAGDQNCAAIGAGVVKAGMASISIGTGGLATVFMSQPFRDPKGKAMVTNHARHGTWQMEGLQNAAAGIFRWFRDEIAALEKEHADRDGGNIYDILDDMIAASPVGAKGLVLLPYYASAGSPRYDPYARGTLLGLTFAHSRADLARAFMEGITMEQRDIMTSMVETGIPVETVRIMGGATKSEVWNQMQADIYGRPVETLQVSDAAVLGAAMAAAVGAGLFKDITEAAGQLVKPAKRYEPDPEKTRKYDALYAIYCQAYEALAASGAFKSLSAFQGS